MQWESGVSGAGKILAAPELGHRCESMAESKRKMWKCARMQLGNGVYSHVVVKARGHKDCLDASKQGFEKSHDLLRGSPSVETKVGTVTVIEIR